MVRGGAVITPAMLMIYKSMSVFCVVSRKCCTFASQPRGSGLRRGTTPERLVVDMGQYFIAYRFILRQVTREEHNLADFFYTQYHLIMINRHPISVKFS